MAGQKPDRMGVTSPANACWDYAFFAVSFANAAPCTYLGAALPMLLSPPSTPTYFSMIVFK